MVARNQKYVSQRDKISACPTCGALMIHACVAVVQCREPSCPVFFGIEDGKCKGKMNGGGGRGDDKK